MLALSTMSPGATAVFYFIFFVLTLVAGILSWWRAGLGWFGLSAFALVLFWNAAAAT